MRFATIPLPTPFPVGDANAYLLGPEPLTLVDCGPRTPDAWAALRRGVERQGHRLEEVKRLVLTHPHPDHAGQARRVREASGCTVLAHPEDHARLLEVPGVWEGIVEFLVEACRRAGAPPERCAAVRAGMEGNAEFQEALDEVEALGEADRLCFGPDSLEVLHTPGHARGALCLWHPQEGVLLSGDTLLPSISSNAILEPAGEGFRVETLPRYLDSLRRLARLPVREVLPGHGGSMGDPRALIGRRLAHHDRRARRVLELVEAGARRPWQIAEALFPAAGPGHAFLTVSEVVGHLDLLALRGEVGFEGQWDPWEAVPLAPTP